MADSVNKILWKFFGDTKNLDKSLSKTQRGFKDTNKAGGIFSGTLGGITKAVGALGIAFGGREVLNWAADAVTAANDYDESVNAMQVVTGHFADEIGALGDKSAEAFGVTKTELNEAAVAFNGFGEQIDPTAVDDVFEDFITRAADFASVMNIDVQDALSKFQSGLAGETEPLRKFGLNLSAAAVEAHAVETGIIEAGQAMSDQEKVQARYSLLMEQTVKTQGDFANTADSAANKSKILTKRFANLKIAVGQKLQPAFEDMLDTGENMLPMLEDLAEASGGMFREVSTLTGGMNDLIGGGEGGVLGALNAFSRLNWEGATRTIPGLNGIDRILREQLNVDLGVTAGLVRDMSEGFAEMGYEDAARGLSDVAYDAWDLAGGLGAAAGNAGDLSDEISNLPQIPSLGDLEPTPSAPGGGGGTATAAAGGPISGTTLVGEAGPELFTPNRAGTITPNHQLGGGGGVTVVLNGFVGDPVALSQQLNDLLELGGRNGG